MPELPEVETLRRALLPLVENKRILGIRFFRKDLRFPIPQDQIKVQVINKKTQRIVRRAKYLLLQVETGSMLWHLGMSGRVIQKNTMDPDEPHTHAIFHFEPDTFLHYIDPRRFGCILWVPASEGHPLINHLGLEPLAPDTTARALKQNARGRKASIKSFLMDSRQLAGVGNIYACESLFKAGIGPKKPAGNLRLKDWEILLQSLRETLEKSIQAGGTTLRDFFNTDGKKGYYIIQLNVYGRENQPCPLCKTPISRIVQIGRSTFFCKSCQRI